MKNNKKPSAFEQAMNSIGSAAKGFGMNNLSGSGFVKEAMSAVKQIQGKIGALPQPRRAKESTGIATLKDGRVLYSDGTIKGGKQPDPGQLEVLRNNVLAQNAFTPQAEKYIRSLPLSYSNNPEVLGQANTRGGPGKPGYGITINPQVFQKGPTTPTEVMAHEFIHALDQNVNQTPFASYNQEGDVSANSYEFYPGLRGKANPKVLKNISGFLGGYAKKEQNGDRILGPQTADVEAFAQYAAPRGQKVLLGPMKNSYGNIFTPASKGLNYSPVYPTRNTIQDLLKDLEDQDTFKG